MQTVETRNPISIGVEAPLSQVARAGNFLFIAGQCALSPKGEVVGEGDAATQTTESIEHMKVILADFHAGLDAVASVTVYLANLKRDYSDFNRAYAEAFGSHLPPRTTVEAPLALDSLLIEIQAVAAI